MTDKSEYSKDLSIDFANLEINLKDQPQLYMKYAELYTDAVSERDKLKEKLDIEKAKLDSKVRRDPDKYIGSGTKLTEAAVSNYIISREEIQDINTDLIEKNRIINLYSSAKTAFDHRMKSMAKQVDLFVAGYWVKPRLTKEQKEVMGKRDRHEEQLATLKKGKIKRRRS
jgi:hypothetical protein